MKVVVIERPWNISRVSIQWDETAVMITCVIGLSGFPLDDEAFSIARPAWDLPIDVILAVATVRQPSFSILKIPSSDITWKWFSAPLLKLGQ